MLLIMFLKLFQTIVCIFSVQVLALIDFGHGQEALEMIEEGKTQYQLMEERGKLPRYGECWQAALEHVNEGCRYLNEDTQSDIALHITNCFLAMSGHEVYNCELDKKPNLRGICINSMSDRAFIVYTEFYTQVQNICWFLRGQIWQEKISERTLKVGKQLKNSLTQQEQLLKQQEQSLQMQERLLQYGLSLERVLNESRVQAVEVMEEIKTSTLKHQQLLSVMADSLGGLKSWLIGEISWFDTLIFYLSSALIILVVTSTARTSSARLPLLLVLSFNVVLERAICDRLSAEISDSEAHLVHESVQNYVWWCRRFTTFICIVILLVLMYTYRDFAVINNSLLMKIQEQNKQIRGALESRRSPDRFSETTEKDWRVDSTTTPLRISPRVPTSKYNLRSRLTPMKHITKDLNLSNGHV